MKLLLLFIAISIMISLNTFAENYWVYSTDSDTYAYEYMPDTVYGDSIYLQSGFIGADPDREQILYLYFDLTGVYIDDFTNAKLYIACIENRSLSPYNLFCVHCDEEEWTENSLTWNNKPDWRPSPIDSQIAPYIPDPDTPEWVMFDATEAMHYFMYSGNRGFAVTSYMADIGRFASSEYGGYTPKLYIINDNPDFRNDIETTSLGKIKTTYK